MRRANASSSQLIGDQPDGSGMAVDRLRAELAARDAALAAKELENKELRAEMATQALRIKNLLHLLYGAKSEKLDPAQFQLLMEGFQPAPMPATAGSAEVETEEAPTPKKRGGRRQLPRQLPVKETIIDVPEDERRGMVKIREQVTEHLERTPARHFVHRIIRYIYAFPDKSQSPVIAPLPPQVFPQSGLGTSVIAHAAVAKFCDHVPLYRQERIAAREGVDLPRQKLGRALESAAELLRAIERAMWQDVLKSQYVQIDETVYKLIDPEQKGQTATGRFWVFNSPSCETVIARFERSKSHEILLHLIPPDWEGFVQSDAAKQYDTFGQKRRRVRLGGCLAHARRKWFDAAAGGGDVVRDILLAIGLLYRIEREARQLRLKNEDRAAHRRARGVPEQLTKLKARVEAARAQTSALPDDNIGRAINYTLTHWEKLALYAQPGCGHLEIDNNLCENSIRPIVLTRKNSLFIGHPDATWVSGVYLSVIGTCRRIGVDPEAYLNWVLPTLAVGTNKSTATGLLPRDFAKLSVKEPSQPSPAALVVAS